MKTIIMIGFCTISLASCSVSRPAEVVRAAPHVVYAVPVTPKVVVVPGYRKHYSIPKSGVSIKWRAL